MSDCLYVNDKAFINGKLIISGAVDVQDRLLVDNEAAFYEDFRHNLTNDGFNRTNPASTFEVIASGSYLDTAISVSSNPQGVCRRSSNCWW